MPMSHTRTRWNLVSAAAVAVLVGTFAPSSARGEVADYAGAYAGTYRAQQDAVERGTWCAIVDVGGGIEGVSHSDVTGRDYPFEGMVTDDGGMAMSTGQTGAGSIFAGMIEEDGSVAGTWRNVAAPERFNGTFEGRRESPADQSLCDQPGA